MILKAMAVALLLLTGAAGARAQEHAGPRASPGAARVSRPFGIPMTRMGSGTTWLPDASPMRAYHFMPGGWTMMVHGDVDLYYDHQGSARGDDQAGSTNWAMLMAMRPLGRGMLHLHGMLSAEPFTVGARGYPLLLQTGESYRGAPLRDRQHPHDLFMELSARYEVPVSGGVGVSVFAAPVGEPAIGPVAYMHRPSAQNDPFAPLGHHWEDATHITFGVLTAGVFTRTVQLEGTLFQGREPDDGRYDFDFGALDSYGGRLTVNPDPAWSLAASYGYLESPEALHPGENQHRLGASILHTARIGRRGEWAGALVYGANRHTAPGGRSRGFEHSLLLESNVQLDERNGIFGRAEWVQKSAEELVISGAPAEARFDVAALTLGYVREVAEYAGASVGLGVRGSIGLLPGGLEPDYGTRAPTGIALYVRVRPAMLPRAGTGSGDEHEGHAMEGSHEAR
ncbi:MAG TPA: hypothetical protein VMY76_12960 [Gemmatimonadales bacterium]|nr:hypothetical protein [Gemmatimonadales bacterium]